jgi:hypothetical protein
LLICQLAIGGQKGGGFCHHRIEVIPMVNILRQLVNWLTAPWHPLQCLTSYNI